MFSKIVEDFQFAKAVISSLNMSFKDVPRWYKSTGSDKLQWKSSIVCVMTVENNFFTSERYAIPIELITDQGNFFAISSQMSSSN
jgi:hypothetical protein